MDEGELSAGRSTLITLSLVLDLLLTSEQKESVYPAVEHRHRQVNDASNISPHAMEAGSDDALPCLALPPHMVWS